MAIDRRALLLGTVALIGAQPIARGNAAIAASATSDVAFASAARRADGSFCVLLIGADGSLIREIPLSARGHDVALHAPSGRAVVFARRPGTCAVAFQTTCQTEPQIFTAAEGRHYYGHGAFSVDGRLLYVSENDIAAARGVIGIYEVARGYTKIGEHPSYGLGPHEIILLADGRTLAVANGGLDTVPEAGRENLNLDAMQPSLTFVDRGTGALLSKHPLAADVNRLSLRHIAADHAGNVWFGGQWEGEANATPSLIGSAGVDRKLRFMETPHDGTLDLKGYVGSMASSIDGHVIAASAPKAGCVIYIDPETAAVIARSDLKDACGIAPDTSAGNFATTSGFGEMRRETPKGEILSEAQLRDISFDNHLRRLI